MISRTFKTLVVIGGIAGTLCLSGCLETPKQAPKLGLANGLKADSVRSQTPFQPKVPKNTKTPGENTKDIQYLSFQMFTYGPGGPTEQLFSGMPIAAAVDEVLEKLGQVKGNGKTTQLAFAIGPLTLNHTDEQMRRDIREAFKIAVDRNIAVAVHIDDSMMWDKRTDLIADKNNVEWTDWNKTVYAHRFIGWLSGASLAPPICYESPKIRTEIRRIAKDVIGAEIQAQYRKLQQQGKQHLFAGVIAGWETRLDDDSNNPKVKFSYCSLTQRGFSAAKPPADMDKELVNIVHRWIEHWAKSLGEAGIPKEKIFTHIAMMASMDKNEVHAPASVAFNEFSNPGFSIYEDNLNTFLGASVQDEFKKHGQPRFAMAEGTNTGVVDGSAAASPVSMEVYLGKFFNRNAALVNIFAWQEKRASDRYGAATNSTEAIAAYKKFLNGEKLDPNNTAVPENPSPSPNSGNNQGAVLQQKMQELQSAVQKAQAEGRDLSEVGKALQELDSLLKAGKVTEAIAAIDKALAMLKSPKTTPPPVSTTPGSGGNPAPVPPPATPSPAPVPNTSPIARNFEFTSSTSWTVPQGVTKVFVTAVGGGGGGSGHYPGVGGGSGEAQGAVVNVTPGQVIPVTIGKGGAGSTYALAQDGRAAEDGGVSSFGSYVSARGGIGGSCRSYNELSGAWSDCAGGNAPASGMSEFGRGGDGYFAYQSKGGRPGIGCGYGGANNLGSAPIPATGYGSGGGGGAGPPARYPCGENPAIYTGGNGTPGIVKIVVY